MGFQLRRDAHDSPMALVVGVLIGSRCLDEKRFGIDERAEMRRALERRRSFRAADEGVVLAVSRAVLHRQIFELERDFLVTGRATPREAIPVKVYGTVYQFGFGLANWANCHWCSSAR